MYPGCIFVNQTHIIIPYLIFARLLSLSANKTFFLIKMSRISLENLLINLSKAGSTSKKFCFGKIRLPSGAEESNIEKSTAGGNAPSFKELCFCLHLSSDILILSIVWLASCLTRSKDEEPILKRCCFPIGSNSSRKISSTYSFSLLGKELTSKEIRTSLSGNSLLAFFTLMLVELTLTFVGEFLKVKIKTWPEDIF